MARIIASIKAVFDQSAFLVRNAIRARHLPILPPFSHGDVLVGPCEAGLTASVIKVYSLLTAGQRLPLKKRLLLRIAGSRYCLVARDANRNTIGMAFYYFNSRDIRENTIHEGYIGLLPEFRSRGLGKELRSRALAHFASVPMLQGMSSRISAENTPSLKGNLQLGFQLIEQYCDPVTGEDRYYLVCRFREASPEVLGKKQGVGR